MRVALVGAGNQATANLYPNLRPAGLEPVAVCDVDRARAEMAGSLWGIPLVFLNVPEMLQSVAVDGVVVCVPPSNYGQVATVCIDAGRPVFCEKPGAASSVEARELAKLGATKDVPIVVGYMKRFAPAYQRARAIIMSPEFGPVSMASFTFAMGQGFDGDLRTYIIDNPVHHFDLARFLVGDLIGMHAEVTELENFGHAIAVASRTDRGAVCTFNFCTTASWRQTNEYAGVFGRGHSVHVSNVDTCTYRPPERPEHVWRPNYTVPVAANATASIMGFIPELEHFRDVVMNGAENESSMTSAADTLALAEHLCALAGVESPQC